MDRLVGRVSSVRLQVPVCCTIYKLDRASLQLQLTKLQLHLDVYRNCHSFSWESQVPWVGIRRTEWVTRVTVLDTETKVGKI